MKTKDQTLIHLAALLAESAKVGWPKRFATDLTEHDARHLATLDPSCSFAWCLRADGTHVVVPSTKPLNKWMAYYAWDFARSIGEVFGEGNCRWYWWNGSTLSQLANTEEAVERVKKAVTCIRCGEVGAEEWDGWYCTGECRTEHHLEGGRAR